MKNVNIADIFLIFGVVFSINGMKTGKTYRKGGFFNFDFVVVVVVVIRLEIIADPDSFHGTPAIPERFFEQFAGISRLTSYRDFSLRFYADEIVLWRPRKNAFPTHRAVGRV